MQVICQVLSTKDLSVSQQGVKVICNTWIRIPEASDLGEAGEVWELGERPATCNEVSCPAHVPARRVVQRAFDLPLPPSHATTTRLLLQVEGSENPMELKSYLTLLSWVFLV